MRVFVTFVIFLAACCAVLLYRHAGLQRFTNRALVDSMRNQRILMVGDSLMRFQYLSLIHLIHTGQFPPEAGTGYLLNSTRMAYIRDDAHRIFGSHEFIDINRGHFFREQRHYHDKKRNISIAYYLYWGEKFTTYGTSLPNPKKDWGARKSANWSYVGILPLLNNIKLHFHPFPTTLILNAGFHSHLYHEPEHRQAVAAAVVGKVPRVIWKTTSCKSFETGYNSTCDANPHDMAMCAMPGFECLNVGWSKYLRESDYWDFLHFNPYVYTEVNIQMIQQLVTRRSIVYAAFQEMRNTVVRTTDTKPALQYAVDDRGLIRYGVHAAMVNGNSTTDCAVAASFIRDINPAPVLNITLAELLTHVTGDPVHVDCLPRSLRLHP
jgi:hypothetical protein